MAKITLEKIKKKKVASLSSQVAAKILSLLVSIVTGGIIARTIGPVELGNLTIAVTILALLSPIATLGINESLSALLCENIDNDKLVCTSLLLRAISAIVLGVLILPICYMLMNRELFYLILLAYLAMLSTIFDVFELKLFNEEKGWLVSRINIFQCIAEFFATLSVWMIVPSVIGFATITVIKNCTKSLLLFCTFTEIGINQVRKLFQYFDTSIAKSLLKRSLPLMISALSIVVYMKSDLILIGILSSTESIGFYSVSVKCAESLYFLPAIFSQTLFPAVGSFLTLGDDKKGVKLFYRQSWLLGVSMMIITVTVLPNVVTLVYGAEFSDSILPIYLLVPASFAVAMGCSTSVWLNLKGYVNLIALRSLVGAITNIILDFALIPHYNINGAAVATSISYLISVYLVGIIDTRTRENTKMALYPFSACN